MENDAENFGRATEIVFRKRIQRAHRYEISTTVQYRVKGEKQWREGIVQNVSISGALICTTNLLASGTSIEMKFSLPVHLRGESAAEVFCRGSVVRSSKCNESGEAALVAVKIERWRFLRQRNTSGIHDISPTTGF